MAFPSNPHRVIGAQVCRSLSEDLLLNIHLTDLAHLQACGHFPLYIFPYLSFKYVKYVKYVK